MVSVKLIMYFLDGYDKWNSGRELKSCHFKGINF